MSINFAKRKREIMNDPNLISEKEFQLQKTEISKRKLGFICVAVGFPLACKSLIFYKKFGNNTPSGLRVASILGGLFLANSFSKSRFLNRNTQIKVKKTMGDISKVDSDVLRYNGKSVYGIDQHFMFEKVQSMNDHYLETDQHVYK